MANTIIVFDSAKERMMLGTLNLSLSLLVGLANNWTTANGITGDRMDTSSVTASVSSFWATSASGGVAVRRAPPLAGDPLNNVTKSAQSRIKFDLSDMAITATSGQNIDAGWAVVYLSVSGIPVCYWEISSATVSGAVLSIPWPAGGLFKTDDSLG